jgi:isopentenyldiphosphate isomerase
MVKFSRERLEEITNRKLNFEVKDNNLILATSLEDTKLGDVVQDVEGSSYEWFQIFDQNDQPYKINGCDTILYRKECHGEDRIRNVYHRGTDIWVINDKNELMVPIRGPNKDLYPSMADNSVGEHNNINENYLDTAVRGFDEELGIKVNKQDLNLIAKLPVYDSNQWQWSQYYVYHDKDGKYNPSEKEISSIEWIKLKDLTDLRVKELNFRPDHLPAFKLFLEKYK